MAYSRDLDRLLETMWAVRSLELIGDHAKNTCEYAIYMVAGRDVRHTSLDGVARELRRLLNERADPAPALRLKLYRA